MLGMVRHGRELVMGCRILELGDKVLESRVLE